MRLLLDEMHAASAAVALRTLGCDVAAVTERPALRGERDEEILSHATDEGRALVTENVRDFMRLVGEWAAHGREHAGLVLTSPRRFHRARRAYPGDLVSALRDLVDDPRPVGPSWVWWL